MNDHHLRVITECREQSKKALIFDIRHKVSEEERVRLYQISESTPVNHQEVIDYLQTAVCKVIGVEQPRLDISIGCTIEELVDAFLVAEEKALALR